jgi:GNAT superfamily N-acetyltransferase
MKLLTVEDIPAAMELSTAAGWNQTPEDWRRMIELEPRACFGIECDGRLVATTTLLCYGTELAWLGMVLTHRDYQRRGFARRLVGAAVDEARGRGVRCVKLDATDQGHDLYASFGFLDEQPIERWRGDLGRAGSPPQATSLPHGFDREAFGTDRSRFLERLPRPAFGTENAYAMTRPGARARYLGPLVARDAREAHAVISTVLEAGPWFWDLLPANAAARILAIEFGFEPIRHLMRMRLGEALRTRDDWIFAIGGFEAG